MFERLFQSFRRWSAPPAVAAVRRPRGAAGPVPRRAVPTGAPAPHDTQAPAPVHVLSWLLDAPAPMEAPLQASERSLLTVLDQQLAPEHLPPDLLPRAPSVVPQLLSLLRREQPSRAAMAEQVLKDMQLTAEVLRLARSPHYGGLPIDTLEAALDRIGSAGLQAAMSRLLLKPVFQVRAGGLMAQAGERVWQLAEHKSLLCAEIAAEHGIDRFEGFLAGLLHDTGTLALLRLLDRCGRAPVLPMSDTLDTALCARRDQLFGRLTCDWDLSPGLTALARQLRSLHPGPDTPLSRALRQADARAAFELAPVRSRPAVPA